MIKRQEDNTALEKISKYESDKEYSIYSEEEAGKFSKKISIPDEKYYLLFILVKLNRMRRKLMKFITMVHLGKLKINE